MNPGSRICKCDHRYNEHDSSYGWCQKEGVICPCNKFESNKTKVSQEISKKQNSIIKKKKEKKDTKITHINNRRLNKMEDDFEAEQEINPAVDDEWEDEDSNDEEDY